MSKRKFEEGNEMKENNGDTSMEATDVKRILSRFKSDSGEVLPGGLLDLPINITVDKLQAICNALLQHEEPIPFAFYVNDVEVIDSLEKNIGENFSSSEDVLEIVYQPQAIFKVRAVTRCTGSLEGILEIIITFFIIIPINYLNAIL